MAAAEDFAGATTRGPAEDIAGAAACVEPILNAAPTAAHTLDLTGCDLSA